MGTTVIRIPLPASGGYFNLGDTFVMAAALLYGPLVGGLVGAIGPAMADALGFPQFILATAVVKGLEGALMGFVAGRSNRPLRAVSALAVGIVVLVAGYYVFEAFIYPLLAQSLPFFGVTDAAADGFGTVVCGGNTELEGDGPDPGLCGLIPGRPAFSLPIAIPGARRWTGRRCARPGSARNWTACSGQSRSTPRP